MLEPLPLDGTEHDPGSLVRSRDAMRFLYEESLAVGNADITRIIEQALVCCDALIAEGQEIFDKSQDPLFYLYFLRAIMELRPDKIRHLVALLRWLEIIPGDNETALHAKA